MENTSDNPIIISDEEEVGVTSILTQWLHAIKELVTYLIIQNKELGSNEYFLNRNLTYHHKNEQSDIV